MPYRTQSTKEEPVNQINARPFVWGAVFIVAMLCGTCLGTTAIEAAHHDAAAREHEAAARQAHEEAQKAMWEHMVKPQ